MSCGLARRQGELTATAGWRGKREARRRQAGGAAPVSRRRGSREGGTRDGKERMRTGIHHNKWQVGKYLTQKWLKVGVEVLSLCTSKSSF